jgi:hypothetical protein
VLALSAARCCTLAAAAWTLCFAEERELREEKELSDLRWRPR